MGSSSRPSCPKSWSHSCTCTREICMSGSSFRRKMATCTSCFFKLGHTVQTPFGKAVHFNLSCCWLRGVKDRSVRFRSLGLFGNMVLLRRSEDSNIRHNHSAVVSKLEPFVHVHARHLHVREQLPQEDGHLRHSSQLEINCLAEMQSGSNQGSYLRLIDCCTT